MLMVEFILFDNIRGAMQVFDIPFVMTSGGPGYASSTFTLYTIKTAFTFSNFGMASTMAVAIMVIIIVVYAQEQAAHPHHVPDELRQCPAGFLADPGCGHSLRVSSAKNVI